MTITIVDGWLKLTATDFQEAFQLGEVANEMNAFGYETTSETSGRECNLSIQIGVERPINDEDDEP